jgi:hypothetical protein
MTLECGLFCIQPWPDLDLPVPLSDCRLQSNNVEFYSRNFRGRNGLFVAAVLANTVESLHIKPTATCAHGLTDWTSTTIMIQTGLSSCYAPTENQNSFLWRILKSWSPDKLRSWRTSKTHARAPKPKSRIPGFFATKFDENLDYLEGAWLRTSYWRFPGLIQCKIYRIIKSLPNCLESRTVAIEIQFNLKFEV